MSEVAIQRLQERLHIPAEDLQVFFAEETPENIVEEVASKYHTNRFEVFKASEDFKTALETERAKTFENSGIKFIKDAAKELDIELSNDQITELKKDHKKFLKIAKEKLNERVTKASTATDADLKAELEKYKLTASEAINLNQSWEQKYTQLEAAKEQEINQFKSNFEAKQDSQKMIAEDKEFQALQLTGKNNTAKLIMDEIFRKYNVLPGRKVESKDGGIAMHPTKNVQVGTLDELWEYYKPLYDLVSRSNAGKGGSDGVKITSVGAPVTDNSELLAKLQKIATIERQG